tara:strand:+ start:264 stop:509 length:246 start_codon:yes stop_codon:yes gene_type:complete
MFPSFAAAVAVAGPLIRRLSALRPLDPATQALAMAPAAQKLETYNVSNINTFPKRLQLLQDVSWQTSVRCSKHESNRTEEF